MTAIRLSNRRGESLTVESAEQAKAWEAVGYQRETEKKAPARKAAASKSSSDSK